MAEKQIQAPVRSEPFPFQKVIYLLIHFTAFNLYQLLLPFTFPLLIHSPQQYLGLWQSFAEEKIFSSSITARKVYILKNGMYRKAFPLYNTSDTKFCPSAGAVMWKIENLYCWTTWVCFTSGEPNANKACLEINADAVWEKNQPTNKFLEFVVFVVAPIYIKIYLLLIYICVFFFFFNKPWGMALPVVRCTGQGDTKPGGGQEHECAAGTDRYPVPHKGIQTYYRWCERDFPVGTRYHFGKAQQPPLTFCPSLKSQAKTCVVQAHWYCPLLEQPASHWAVPGPLAPSYGGKQQLLRCLVYSAV